MLTQEARPKLFSQVAGQDLLKKTLRAMVKNPKKAPKSIFIYGEYGTGKTTNSRIFAKAINCLSPTPSGEPCLKCNHCMQDINNCIYYNEYDSSTIGNTESMEQLKDKLSMTVEGYTIINVFDEIHLASSQAQSKLLKTIEEAPYGVIFIFCTTHPDKVIPTIKSRSLMVEATLVGRQDIINNLRKVSKDNNIEVNDQILGIIATKAKGHMRNAHMLLDSYILLGDDFLDAQSGAREEFIRYLGAILKKDRNLLLKAISGLSTRPISTLKDELDGLLLDLVELDLKQDPTNDLMKYSKALKPILLDFIRVYNEPWVSFESDLTAQTSLMAIYQILERR